MTKKKMMLLAGAIGLVLLGAGVGYNPVASTATLKGNDLPSCQASCSSPCFCNRSCFITWCWGPWYCQCN